MSATAVQGTDKKFPRTPWGYLPPRLRLLFIAGGPLAGGWLNEAFSQDSACDVQVEEVGSLAAGLARLREAIFDAVLVHHAALVGDAWDMLEVIRAGSSEDQPIVVLGEAVESEVVASCYEAGGDAYICLTTTTTRALLWTVARATERHQLIVENRRLAWNQRQRLQLEHTEASRMLEQQREMITDIEALRGVACPRRTENAESATERDPSTAALTPQLQTHYRDLLRAYVIMGSGNLADELSRLGELLASAAATGQQVMRLHLQTLEELVDGLGNRSARHVMTRADLLILEVMINLAERYRERYRRRAGSAAQPVHPEE